MEDVIVLNVSDDDYPVGFNVLNQGDPKVAAEEICNLFNHLFQDNESIWAREFLYYGLRTLIEKPESTFVDLATLLAPRTPEERDWAQDLGKLGDRDVRRFWERFDKAGNGRGGQAQQDRIVQPAMDRIWQLTGRPQIRNIIGQSQSSFQMTEVVARNKIVLVNLAGLAPETAKLTGTLLVNALWHAAKEVRSKRTNVLMADEFHHFVNMHINPEEMLVEARSFRLAMVLAHQHLGQLLPAELRRAVNSNARSKIIFQADNENARAMAREFGSSVEEHDIQFLGKYETIARVMTPKGVSSPLSMTTNEPMEVTGIADEVVARSRERYGRPVKRVVEDMESRHKAQGDAVRRPSAGRNELWGVGGPT